jgi:hypothetical protein
MAASKKQAPEEKASEPLVTCHLVQLPNGDLLVIGTAAGVQPTLQLGCVIATWTVTGSDVPPVQVVGHCDVPTIQVYGPDMAPICVDPLYKLRSRYRSDGRRGSRLASACETIFEAYAEFWRALAMRM